MKRRIKAGRNAALAHLRGLTANPSHMPGLSMLNFIRGLSLVAMLALLATTSTPTSAQPRLPVEKHLTLDIGYDGSKLNVDALTSGELTPQDLMLLNADIAAAPLREVLALLARDLHVKVLVADAVPDDPVYATFEKLSLQDALARLLKGRNYILRYARLAAPNNRNANSGEVGNPASAGMLAVSEIHILPPGSANDQSIALKEVSAAEPVNYDEELAQLADDALGNEDPAQRLKALEAYTMLATDAQIVEIVEPLLSDESKEVRGRAIVAVGDLGSKLREGTAHLLPVLSEDPDPEIRMEALETYVTLLGSASRPVVQAAMADPDPQVRERAQLMLEQLQSVEEWEKQRTADADDNEGESEPENL